MVFWSHRIMSALKTKITIRCIVSPRTRPQLYALGYDFIDKDFRRITAGNTKLESSLSSKRISPFIKGPGWSIYSVWWLCLNTKESGCARIEAIAFTFSFARWKIIRVNVGENLICLFWCFEAKRLREWKLSFWSAVIDSALVPVSRHESFFNQVITFINYKCSCSHKNLILKFLTQQNI